MADESVLVELAVLHEPHRIETRDDRLTLVNVCHELLDYRFHELRSPLRRCSLSRCSGSLVTSVLESPLVRLQPLAALLVSCVAELLGLLGSDPLVRLELITLAAVVELEVVRTLVRCHLDYRRVLRKPPVGVTVTTAFILVAALALVATVAGIAITIAATIV